MESQVVQIGDTEVQVQETEDGFEAVAVEDEPDSGVYLRAESSGAMHGFEVPIDADFVIRNDDRHENWYLASWHTDDDISDIEYDNGYSGAEKEGYDGYATVEDFEIVEY